MSITNCHGCGALFDARSEEYANEPGRLCRACVAVLSDETAEEQERQVELLRAAEEMEAYRTGALPL